MSVIDLEALPEDLPDNVRTRTTVVHSHWIWQGAITNGYAQSSVLEDGVRVPAYAHRIVYAALRELDPSDVLRRSCGKRACINPDHWRRIVKVPRA